MKLKSALFSTPLLLLMLTACGDGKSVDVPVITPSPLTSEVYKPRGAFMSKLTTKAIANTNARGALIRVRWSDIEPTADGDVVFDKSSDSLSEVFQKSLDALVLARGAGAKYSLAIIAGPSSPDWLKAECELKVKCENLSLKFRNNPILVPRAWDLYVQQRLDILAQKVAAKLKNDTRLELVYVPQMTVNGIEGHFNGNTTTYLQSIGMSAENWTSASVAIAKSFALAFDNKAIAFEVHDVLGTHTIPEAILKALWEAPETKGRVGAAMWWINGQLDYQPKLVQVLKDFPGDKYGQIIGNSSQDCNPSPTCTDIMSGVWSNYGRYGIETQGGGFASVFVQAKELKMRYIEPWNYEFEVRDESGSDPKKLKFAQAIKDYNSWADSTFP